MGSSLIMAALKYEDIVGRWKLQQYGSGANMRFGPECLDKGCFTRTEFVNNVAREGGIGLELEEFDAVNSNRNGLVLVSGVKPGSNAEKAGNCMPGDALLTVTPKSSDPAKNPLPTISLEGLSYDATIDILSGFDDDVVSLSFTTMRMIKRGEVLVKVVGPQNEEVTEYVVYSGFGVNLRTTLQSKNLKMYDPRTARFDSPYQTGNCGGDGTCGTCMVGILEGANLLNEKTLVEEKGLLKQVAPPNYRWSCRVKIGKDPEESGVLKVKLRPQSVYYDNE